jgi:hypothetical protein
MARLRCFIRRRGDDCSIVKVLPGGGEEILETGLTLRRSGDAVLHLHRRAGV